MRVTNLLIAPICTLAVVVCSPGYSEEPASKEPSAVQRTPAPDAAAAKPATPASATPAAAPTASAPPPIDRKKALQFGFRPGVVNGVPVFCKEVPIEGTRFTNKRCVREDQFSAFLSQLQVARDAAVKNGCYGADFCGNVDSMSGKSRMSMGTSR